MMTFLFVDDQTVVALNEGDSNYMIRQFHLKNADFATSATILDNKTAGYGNQYVSKLARYKNKLWQPNTGTNRSEGGGLTIKNRSSAIATSTTAVTISLDVSSVEM